MRRRREAHLLPTRQKVSIDHSVVDVDGAPVQCSSSKIQSQTECNVATASIKLMQHYY